MSYSAAIDQLNAMTPELFTRPGQPRRKFSLDEVRILLNALGNPQTHFPSVLIAGTNGKGSTASTLASILTESGYHTGLYTSPHLERVNERIRVNRALIPDDDFARLYFRIHAAAEALVADGSLPQHSSFFETLTALAFLYFAEQHIDIAVLEVGMGGRLDATNIVNPLLSVITDISLDHTEWLGPTIAAITREKAGILRPHGTLITLPQHPEANQVLGEIAAAFDVRGLSATPYMPPLHADPTAAYPIEIEVPGFPPTQIEVASPLPGAHQHRNIALAIAAAVELAHLLPPNHKPEAQLAPRAVAAPEREAPPAARVVPATIAAGIRATQWPGRLERLTVPDPTTGQPTEFILDVAHNPAGAWALRAGLSNLLHLNEPAATPATLVFSCLRDKPLAEMAQILFPLFERVIFAPIHSVRAAAREDLLAAASSTGTPAYFANSVAEALTLATSRSDRDDPQAQTISPPTTPGALAPEENPDQTPAELPESTGAAGIAAPPVPHTVVISGSVYLVGEARSLLLARQSQAPAELRP
jgi:dihydrofolate synthase/folylpolyglutamate synthase